MKRPSETIWTFPLVQPRTVYQNCSQHRNVFLGPFDTFISPCLETEIRPLRENSLYCVCVLDLLFVKPVTETHLSVILC